MGTVFYVELVKGKHVMGIIKGIPTEIRSPNHNLK